MPIGRALSMPMERDIQDGGSEKRKADEPSANGGGGTTNVCVAVHVRPLVDLETAEGCQESIYTSPGQPQVTTATNLSFNFDYVFGPSATPSSRLFDECVLPLVDGLFKGYNATVLAYGQTGSGKTFTMGSAFTHGGPQHGVIPRVMETLFARIHKDKENTDFAIRVGFVEIHMEEIRDLLVSHGELCPSVTVREVAGGGVCLAGAKEKEVTTYAEMAAVLNKGTLCRATSATSMNACSSRSHAIFTITLEQRRRVCPQAKAPEDSRIGGEESSSDEEAEEDAGDEYLCAKMHLVDLAGSERVKRTKAEGQQLQEGIHINKGLLALGNVISALCDDSRSKGSHVPYRNSKLTRLLQDSLGGNSRTCMVACVSPADINMEETINTLKYAARARNICNTPVVNRDAGSAQVAHLKQQLAAARAEVACLKKAMHGPGGGGGGVVQAALEELEGQVEEKQKELERKNVQLVSLRKEADETHSALLAARAERDVMEARLAKAKEAGYIEEDEFASLTLTQVETYLARIAKLESENRRLKQMQHHTNAFFTARRQSGAGMTPGKTAPGATPMSPFPLAQPDCDADLDNPEDEGLLEEQSRSTEHTQLETEYRNLQLSIILRHVFHQNALSEKEKALQVLEAKSKASAIKQMYDRVLSEANAEKAALSKQMAKLSQKLEALRAQGDDNRKVMEEKYRSQIKELKERMKEASKRASDAERFERLKSRTEETCKRLRDEILEMKQQKVALAKAVEQSHKELNAYKRARDKELMQAKRAGMKSAAEVQRLSALHDKHQQVLKRKTEEAKAAKRRLQEMSSKVSANKKLREGMSPAHAKQWVEKELEGCNQVLDMQRVLDGEKALRGESARRLTEVRRLLAGIQHPEFISPKRLSASPMRDQGQLLQEEQELERAIMEHSKQITILQEKIMKAEKGDGDEGASKKDRDDKDLRRWDFVKGIADARLMLRTVFKIAATYKSLACETDAAYAESRDELELVRLQYQQAEFEARMAKRSAAEAEAALAAALDASAATEAALAASIAAREKEDRRRGEEGTNDGELAELLQELDNVHVEMTGGGLVPYEGENGSLSVSKSLSAVLEKAPGSAAAVRYSHESPESSGHDYYTDEGLEDPESEIEEDEEDSDPTWDLAHATPKLRAGGRKRAQSSIERPRSGKWDHWRHPASGAPTAAGNRKTSKEEGAVMEAVNQLRAEAGKEAVEKLTVPVLKDFLKGQIINGVAWRAGQKTRSQLLSDCHALLGMCSPQESEGNGNFTPQTVSEAAQTPIPTLRGFTATPGQPCSTPSTINARESAARYLQMATDARQRAARLKHSMEQQRSGESESKTTGSASGSVLRLSLSGDSDVTSAPRALGERDINTEKPVALANAGPKRKTTHLPAAHGPF